MSKLPKVVLILIISFLIVFGLVSLYIYEYGGHVCSRMSIPDKAKYNIKSISTCEEAIMAESGVYLACKPYPPDGDTDREPDVWDEREASDFSSIGFAPKRGKVYYQYAVEVSEDGQAYTATAKGCEDGNQVIYSITDKRGEIKRSPPKGLIERIIDHIRTWRIVYFLDIIIILSIIIIIPIWGICGIIWGIWWIKKQKNQKGILSS